MQYQLGEFYIDCRRKLILARDNNSIICDNYRIAVALGLLIDHYPDVVPKETLLKTVWSDSIVTESSLSRLVADLRQLFSIHDKNSQYIKTIHRKGFQLLVNPLPIVNPAPIDLPQENEHPIALPAPGTPGNTKLLPIFQFYLPIILSFILISVIGFIFYFNYVIRDNSGSAVYPNLAIAGQTLKPAQTLIIPLTKNWWASGNTKIKYENNKVSLIPEESGQLFTSANPISGNFYGATLTLDVELDEPFLNSGANVQPFAQITRGSWPGEWECWTENADLTLSINRLSCQLKEPGGIFYLKDNEKIRLGLRPMLWDAPIQGKITVHGASVQLLPSLSLQKYWHSTLGDDAKFFDEGLHFKPQNRGDRVYTYLDGPLQLEGKTMHIGIAADEDYIASGSSIKFIVQSFVKDWPGVWQCWVNNEDLSVEGDTYSCEIKSLSGGFNLAAGEKMQIGIDAEGKKMKGSLRILGVNFE